MVKKVVFLFETDSQAKCVRSLVSAFETLEWQVRVICIQNFFTKSYSCDKGVVESIIRTAPEYSTIERLFQEETVRDSALIFSLCPSWDNTALVSRYVSSGCHRLSPRPLLASGYYGVSGGMDSTIYLPRMAMDYVFLPSPMDLQLCRKYPAFMCRNTHHVTGLPHVDIPAEPLSENLLGSSEIRVLFASQNLFPSTREERKYLIRSLMDFCRNHPGSRVVLKPRDTPGAFRSVHHGTVHDEEVVREEAPPSNFTISYEPIEELLDETNLLLTISSTAAMDALVRGVKVGIVRDDVLCDPGYYYEYFEGSGLFMDFDMLNSLQFPEVNNEWFAYHLKAGGSNALDIANGCDALVRSHWEGGSVPFKAFTWFVVKCVYKTFSVLKSVRDRF